VPDFAAVAPARPRPRRRTLTFLVVPIVGFIVLSNIGDAMAPGLVDKHPLVLLALNARNRNLILVTNHLSAWSYYLVGTVRLVISDPLFYLLGYWWGDAALTWMERRTRTLGTTLRQWESWFGKAALPILFIAPNQYICLFAGAAGMDLVTFFAVSITGILARLYLIRLLGQAFNAPIEHLLHFIADYRTPLLVVSILLVLVLSVSELRRGGPRLEDLEDLEDPETTDEEPDEAPADAEDPPVEPRHG
jgi:membrane protein DedA with SNARE-associated domain